MTDAYIEPKIVAISQRSPSDCRKRLAELYKVACEQKNAHGKTCPVTGRPSSMVLNYYGKNRKRQEVAGLWFANSAAAFQFLNLELQAHESVAPEASLCAFIKNIIECTIKPIPKKILSAQAAINKKYIEISASEYKIHGEELARLYGEYDALTRRAEKEKPASPPKSPRKKRVESMDVDGDGNITANEKKPKKRVGKKRKAEEESAAVSSKIAKPLDADEVSQMLLEAFP